MSDVKRSMSPTEHVPVPFRVRVILPGNEGMAELPGAEAIGMLDSAGYPLTRDPFDLGKDNTITTVWD